MYIMKSRFTIVALSAALLMLGSIPAYSSSKEEKIDDLAARVFAVAEKQAAMAASQLDATTLPKSMKADGTMAKTICRDWVCGFFPGTVWYIYAYNKDPKFKDLAWEQTQKCAPVQFYRTTHDVGFMINCSYGNALRVGGIEESREVLRNAAHSLATRFNPVVGCTRSWDAKDSYRVIIDNMMNLELLVRVADMFNEPQFRDISFSHADVTMKNHFRPDYSSYHVLNYVEETGEVTKKYTGQGYADESTWARGQAWALYGFTMMAEKTGEKRYLEQAEKIARWTIENLPEDYVQYWDYTGAAKILANEPGLDRKWAGELPDGSILRDASAAAITASAFVKLSETTKDRKFAKLCRKTAIAQVRALASSEYLAEPGTNCGFLLKHGTGAYHGNSEVDVPLSYADYYFLEAILRLQGKVE